MYAKQGRSKIYGSKEERDKALKKEIDEIKSTTKKHQEHVFRYFFHYFILLLLLLLLLCSANVVFAQVKELKQNVAATKKALGQKVDQVKVLTGNQEERRRALEESQKKILDKKADRDRAANERKYEKFIFV